MNGVDHGYTLGLDEGTDTGFFPWYVDGYNEGNPEVSLIFD